MGGGGAARGGGGGMKQLVISKDKMIPEHACVLYRNTYI